MSQIFPVTDSVLSANGLISEVMSRYNIGVVTECRFLHRGVNDTYRVSADSGKFILRVYRKKWRTRSDIHFELDALLHLHNSEVPVSIPVMRNDGELIGAIQAPEGSRFVVLFTHAEGVEPAYDGDGTRDTNLYARAVARIHAATDDFKTTHQRYSLDFEHLLAKPLQSMEPFLSHRPKDWDYVTGLAHRLRSLFSDLPLAALETGFCHGDLHGWNAHINQNSKLTVFDFDCCGFGWHSYDLAVFYWGARIRGKHEERWPSFLCAYQEERQLADVDIQAIPFFVAIRHFWLLGLLTSSTDFCGSGWLNDKYLDGSLKFFRDWEADHIGGSDEG